jgi:hypothetical protein
MSRASNVKNKPRLRDFPCQPPKRQINGKWCDGNYLKCYLLAKTGLTNKQIQQTIGVSQLTFRSWLKKYPYLQVALNEARNINKPNRAETFIEYVHARLSPEGMEIWDKINAWEQEPNSTKRIFNLLESQGKQMRQHLFLHALVSSNFNPSEACRRVCIAKKTLMKWTQTDLEFNQLMQEIDWHKKNFLEGGLFKLVEEGDTIATIFANKTQNRDRGYDERQTIEVKGSIHHTHSIDIDSLNLSLEVRRAILEAINLREEALRLSTTEQDFIPRLPTPDIIDSTASESAA